MSQSASHEADGTDPLIGRTLDGRYRIERTLGEGGMGIVYKAVHTTLGKTLAIKVLRPEVSKNEEILQRFRQEAQSASQIGNPHIIDIIDFGTLPDGATYFAMELLGGTSLTAALQAGPFDVARTVHVVRQLAAALSAAHEIGIVHRDLKPDNVQLLDRGGQKDFVKVLDFGIAKVGGSTSKLTQAGQIFGTPHYMAPEQCAGQSVDARTDVYAIGVILYEMTCGQVPFDAENLMGILTKQLYEAPVAPRDRTPAASISPELEAVILKCLRKKPEQRYQTMAELQADLDALDRGQTPKAVADRGPSSQRPVVAGPQTLTGVEARVTLDGSTTDIKLRKNKAPLYIGAATVGAIIALGLWLTMAPSASTPSASAPGTPDSAPGPVPTPAIGSQPEATKPPPSAAPVLPAAPALPAAPVQLSIKSSPEQAEVFLDGLLVGTTPYTLTRPNPGKPLAVQLRLAGYQAKTVELTDRSSDQVVQLQKQPAPAATIGRPATRPARPERPEPARAEPTRPAPAQTEPARTESPRPRPAQSGKRPAPRGEVLDPWN